ncbi:Uncharacterised protein [Mycobacteroides abscessus subsp. abscessus]|nr:Uncharacterised protein [Mycobacteroides abscessus subsp. abscessus]
MPPQASRRRKCDLPVPFPPNTATRSPYHSSVSKGLVKPVNSRFSAITARLAVRPPASRIRTFCRNGTASGGPASSKRRSRVSAACRRLAISEL